MKRNQIAIGQHLTWLHEPRGGYGYIVPVNAEVMKIGPKRIQIEAKKCNGEMVRRWVTPDRLKEKSVGLR